MLRGKMAFLKQFQPILSRRSLLLVRSGGISFSTTAGNPSFWEHKMRVRFEQMDIDKDGVFSDKDIRRLTDKLVKFSGNPETYSLYYDTVSSVWSYGFLKGENGEATVEQFVEGMKSFIALPDAEERVTSFCDTLFRLADKNGDDLVSYEEMRDFLNNTTEMSQEMIDMLILQTDTNSDGLIQLSEYRQSLLNFFFKETK